MRTNTLAKSRRQHNYIYVMINGLYTVQQMHLNTHYQLIIM